jgi:hypothetical protein
MGRLACAPRVHGTLESDQQDDELIAHDEAAALIFGLQDRTTRDRAAEWMEGDVAAPALRLWRSLARRCVGPYTEYAAAPLTLTGWVAWSAGDELEAREALAMALGANPDYTLARLLHQACNEGVGPEAIRRCLRHERADQTTEGAAPGVEEPAQTVHGEPVSATSSVTGQAPETHDSCAVALKPASDRPRRSTSGRSGPRGTARRGPQPTRPSARTAATGPGAPRPPRHRTTGSG